MKESVALVVGALLVAGALAQGTTDLVRGARDWSRLGPLPPGTELPAFEVRTMAGARFGPDELRGKVTVVTFWATWCGVCRDELADLDELDDQYEGRDDVQFLAVNREGGGVPLQASWARARGYVTQRQLRLPIAIDDGSMSRTFRVGPIPHTVLFDRTGTLRHVHQGRVLSSTLAEEIDELLAEEG